MGTVRSLRILRRGAIVSLVLGGALILGAPALATIDAPSGVAGVVLRQEASTAPTASVAATATPGPTADVATIADTAPVAPTADVAPTRGGGGGGHYPRPSESSLPVTPAGDAVPYLSLGVLFLLAGTVVILWLRRTRKAHES